MKRAGPPLDAVRPSIRELVAYPIEHESVRVKLDANESSLELPPELIDSVRRLTATVDLRRYPSGHSEALIAKLADRLGVVPESALVGNGSNEMISLVLTAFAGPTPDGSAPVLVLPTPSFGVYPIQATCHGWRIEAVPLRDDYRFDGLATLDAARRVDARMILLASPNNPTGNRFERTELERVLDGFDGPVVVDEAYEPFSDDTLMGRWDRWPHLVVLRTLSKIGLAALRVGFLFAHPGLTAELRKAKLPFNLNALSGQVAEAAVDHWPALLDQAAQIVRARDELSRGLAEISRIRVFPSQANFVLFRVEGDASHLAARLLERGISIRNFSTKPRLTGCLRVTVGRPDENEAFLTALRDLA